MVTLLAVIVIGGGSVAVAGSGGSRAIKKVVLNLAPTLTVAHAGSADSANEATHAKSADSASSASSAANASHANNADLLGGAAASSFYPANRVTRGTVDVTQTANGTRTDPWFSTVPNGPLSMFVQCTHSSAGVGSQQINFTTFGQSGLGASIHWAFSTSTDISGGNEEAGAGSNGVGGGGAGTFTRTVQGVGGALPATESGGGEFLYRDNQNTFYSITFDYFVSFTTGQCQAYALAFQAPG